MRREFLPIALGFWGIAVPLFFVLGKLMRGMEW